MKIVNRLSVRSVGMGWNRILVIITDKDTEPTANRHINTGISEGQACVRLS